MMMKGRDIPTLYGLPATNTDDLKSICRHIKNHTEHLDDNAFEKLFGRYVFKAYGAFGSLMFIFNRKEGEVVASVIYDREDKDMKEVDVRIF